MTVRKASAGAAWAARGCSMIEKEQLLTRKPVFEGRLLHVYEDTVEIAGRQTWREVVLHPGAAAIIPVNDDGQILFVRQYRYAVGEALLEIPAGKLDPGEDPDTCAARELTEETGYRAGRLQKLGAVHTTPGFCNETIHLYLADHLIPAHQHLDTDEFLDVVPLPIQEVRRLMAAGELHDAKTLAALAIAMDKL